ncbi:MAG: polyhydroxyalkanoate synthesis regulator DNA-binding domain-containing protein [Polyangiales bacterium]
MSTPRPEQSSNAGSDPAGAAPRVVKRYSNRKLYDTVESRYVTLTQIAELVRQGEEVRIIDNASKEDLTRMTLAQILYEEERKQSRALPIAALKELIHTSSERIIESLKDTPMGKLIARGGEGVEAAPPPEPAPPPPPVEAAPEPAPREPSRFDQFVGQGREAIDQWQHRVDTQMRTFWEGINPATQIQALQAEVKRLQQRVDDLEARLGSKGGE